LDVPDVSKEMGWVNTSDLNGGPGLTVPDLAVGASGLFVWDPTQNTYALKDDFSLTRGKHSIKVGFNLNERRLYFLNQSFDKGRLTLTISSRAPVRSGTPSASKRVLRRVSRKAALGLPTIYWVRLPAPF
jgi:hypothetical protein